MRANADHLRNGIAIVCLNKYIEGGPIIGKNCNVSWQPYARSYNWMQVVTRIQKFVVNIWMVQLVEKRRNNGEKSWTTGPIGHFDHREKFVGVLNILPKKIWFRSGTRHQKFVVNLWKVQLVARGWKNGGKSCNAGPVRLFDDREKSVDIVKTYPNKLEYVSRRHVN